MGENNLLLKSQMSKKSTLSYCPLTSVDIRAIQTSTLDKHPNLILILDWDYLNLK